MATRLAEEGQLESLEDLEHALHFGNLFVEGLGPRRKQMIAAILAERLGRPLITRSRKANSPPRALLLEIDRAYRERASSGLLRKIAPRRFNPIAEAWLPVMHVSREGSDFTALYSNSKRAPELNKTGDWVVIHYQRDGASEGRVTVVTQVLDPVGAHRVVHGLDGVSGAKDG